MPELPLSENEIQHVPRGTAAGAGSELVDVKDAKRRADRGHAVTT